jgi:preprotein translocase subunit YajC
LNYTLLVVLIVLVLGAMLLARRNRARAVAREATLRENIGFGTEVMTTSGLYGTVVGMNDDDTVQLSIAPGIEVKWAVAALRDRSALPGRYQQGLSASEHRNQSDLPRSDED